MSDDKKEPIIPGKDTAPDRPERRIRELQAELQQTLAENATLKARLAKLERMSAETKSHQQRVILTLLAAMGLYLLYGPDFSPVLVDPRVPEWLSLVGVILHGPNLFGMLDPRVPEWLPLTVGVIFLGVIPRILLMVVSIWTLTMILPKR